MHVWVTQMERKGLPLTTDVLIELAKTFGAQLQVLESFSFSHG